MIDIYLEFFWEVGRVYGSMKFGIGGCFYSIGSGRSSGVVENTFFGRVV